MVQHSELLQLQRGLLSAVVGDALKGLQKHKRYLSSAFMKQVWRAEYPWSYGECCQIWCAEYPWSHGECCQKSLECDSAQAAPSR